MAVKLAGDGNDVGVVGGEDEFHEALVAPLRVLLAEGPRRVAVVRDGEAVSVTGAIVNALRVRVGSDALVTGVVVEVVVGE